ncbi:MAG: S8 family serine peptidase, partial [Myxococcales bacterium]|nr:S8 family serine peptidase [Myxococcales bacterium]
MALRATGEDDGEAPDHAGTVALADALTAAGAAPRVELDFYRQAFARPTDPEYRLQWHYAQMGMEAAWDLTTGSEGVVCAVVDDGVNAHPELAGRLLPGRDMVSEPDIAGDGDLRDGDPSQVARCCGGQSVWHGLHVAGTIAAKADGAGVVGVDWACKVLPVRVLGRELPQGGSGTSVDIVAGIYWAAGYEIPGEPVNRNPAAVINLSLGGGTPSQAEQEAVNAAVQAGAVIVAASGNSDEDAGSSSFGAYDNVILVGATDYSGGRSSYSNYGDSVDVMAPGGAVTLDANADGQPDGVLSTFLDADGREPGLYFLEGTSMAAPHVSGLVALMKALRPSLTHAEAERILKETADPGARCRQGCGAGLVNAPAALRAVGAQGQAQAPRLSVSAERLNLGAAQQGQVRVFNAGGGTLAWSARLTGAAAGNLRIAPAQGSLGAGGSATVTVTPDRGGLADGSHQATLVVSSDGGEARLAVQFTVGAASTLDVGQVQVATLRPLAGDQVEIGGQAVVGAASQYAFSFPSAGGEWIVLAAADRNGNQVLDDGDLLGFWRSATEIQGVAVGAGGVAGLGVAVVRETGEGIS